MIPNINWIVERVTAKVSRLAVETLVGLREWKSSRRLLLSDIPSHPYVLHHFVSMSLLDEKW